MDIHFYLYRPVELLVPFLSCVNATQFNPVVLRGLDVSVNEAFHLATPASILRLLGP